jgi:hypothetical protein
VVRLRHAAPVRRGDGHARVEDTAC